MLNACLPMPSAYRRGKAKGQCLKLYLRVMMQKILTLLIPFALVMASISAAPPSPAPEPGIQWLTWQEAYELSKVKPKKLFINIYTDWCGFCKRMDATTFQDPEVILYVNEHFYPVKLNAEMKEEIEFRGHVFAWVDGGRRGVHTLAYSLLEGKMGYPSFVTMNEDYDRIAIMPGYKVPQQLLKELRFAAEEQYKYKSHPDD